MVLEEFGRLIVDMVLPPDSEVHSHQVIPIQKGQSVTIGRSEESTLVMNHPAISSSHCFIWAVQFDDDSIPLIYIKDTSLNGTVVNGAKLSKNQVHLLSHQDIINIQHGAFITYESVFEKNESLLGEMVVSENKIKTVFPNWGIKYRVLGNGTFGHVLVTERRFDQKLCAVKVVKSTEEYIPFEAKMLSKLNHPNIIKVHETLVFEEKLYIFEELVFGGDLFSYLVNGSSLKALPEFESLFITFQILNALSYLHKNHVVHRDLKLDNILLESPEPLARIVLVDFGIAKATSLTKRRMYTTVGTPEYCAPEVGFEFTKLPEHLRTGIFGQASLVKKGYDDRCDVWSLGVIVHILLSGISPFYENGEEIYIIQSAKRGNLKFQSKQWTAVSKSAQDFVKSLLQVEIHKRPSTKEAMSNHWVSKHLQELTSIYKKVMRNSLYPN